MRWQRPARFVIAAMGLGIAAFIYARYERKPAGIAAPLPPRMEEGATYRSVMSPGARQVRFKGDVEIGSWSYATMQQYSDGRRIADKIRWEGDRDGKPFVVSADRAEMKAPDAGTNADDVPEETHLIGNVTMKEKDGIEIKTNDAMYRASIATLDIPGAMTFDDGRASGSGVGAVYDRNQQLLTLKDQAVIHMAADQTGQGRFDAQSKSMLINRATHFASLDSGARIARDHEILSADTAKLHLSEDNHGIQLLELNQHASIVPTGSGGQTPEMRGDDISVNFQPDGRTIQHTSLLRNASMFISNQSGRKQVIGDTIDVSLGADGQTVTQLSSNGNPVSVGLPATRYTPERLIKAKQLRADGSSKGLESARFLQSVSFLETRAAENGQPAVRREVTSSELVLALDSGDLSDIKNATFNDNVKFVDGVKSGSADKITYFASENKLALLSPASKPLAFVQTDRIRVDAHDIKLTLDKTTIDATDDKSIRTSTIPDKSKAKQGGLFDETKSTTGIAKRLVYDADKNAAVYTGSVTLLQQGSSRIDADSVTLDDVKGDITAVGTLVKTSFRVDGMQNSSSGLTTAESSKFEYSSSDHRARYTGFAPKGTDPAKPALLNGADGKIFGGAIDLFLTDDAHDLKRMVVTSNVVARVATDRTVRVDKLEFDAKANTYKLSGNNSRVIQRTVTKGAEACRETIGTEMTFGKTESGQNGTFAWSDPTGAGSMMRDIATCATWIIK